MSDSNYIQVCGISTHIEKRDSDKGKTLKYAFLLGPSQSVTLKGKILVDEDIPAPESGNPEGGNPNESLNYSIYESYKQIYSIYHIVNEGWEDDLAELVRANRERQQRERESAERAEQEKFNTAISSAEESFNAITPEDKADAPETYSQAADKLQEMNTAKDASDKTAALKAAEELKDLSKKVKNDAEAKRENDKEGELTSNDDAYAKIIVKSFLYKEGYTEWDLRILNSNANISNVKELLKSGKFEDAYNEASKGYESDGLFPISAKTYIYKEPLCKVPFVGHCKYAFDTGSDDRTICIAVAPIDMATKEPKKATVIKAEYNVVGDITKGFPSVVAKFKDLKNFISSNNQYERDDGKSDEEKFSKELSEFLNKIFKCTGDSKTYGNFLDIRKFVEQQLKEKNLEIDKKGTVVENISDYKVPDNDLFIY